MGGGGGGGGGGGVLSNMTGLFSLVIRYRVHNGWDLCPFHYSMLKAHLH